MHIVSLFVWPIYTSSRSALSVGINGIKNYLAFCPMRNRDLPTGYYRAFLLNYFLSFLCCCWTVSRCPRPCRRQEWSIHRPSRNTSSPQGDPNREGISNQRSCLKEILRASQDILYAKCINAIRVRFTTDLKGTHWGWYASQKSTETVTQSI